MPASFVEENAGKERFTGFDDTKDTPEDPAECGKLFKELMDKAMKQPVIDFTVVE